MMNSGIKKPPVAPKPKLVRPQTAGLAPLAPKGDAVLPPSSGTAKSDKPVPAPKPCLSKLTTAVESKPIASNNLQKGPLTESPWIVGVLNAPNEIQQENKKPDWDYIIPICLCSQEKCLCSRDTSTIMNKMEKGFKTSHKGKTEEKRKPIPQGTLGNKNEKTKNAKNQVLNVAFTKSQLTIPKPLQETKTLDKNLNTSSSQVTARLSLPRMWSDEENVNIIPQCANGQGPEEDAHGPVQKLSVCQPKPAIPRKPVPVLQKPTTAALVCQEKVEEKREEIASQDRGEIKVNELKVSSEGKGSASLPVSVAVNENKRPPSLARKACPPPAPPPKKKPYLSLPEKALTSPPSTPPKDLEAEDLVSDSSVSEMEITVGRDDEGGKEGRSNHDGVCSDFIDCSPSSGSLCQPEISLPPVSAKDGVVKLKKPQRNASMMARMQKTDSSEENEEGKSGDTEKRQKAMRELPLLPDEKTRTPGVTGVAKQRPKSFSSVNLGQRNNSFRKLLEMKLSMKILPKLMGKGLQTPNSSVNDSEQCMDSYQDRRQSFNKHQDPQYSCRLVGAEQTPDGDEPSPSLEQDVDYENIPHYEEISDYMNVVLGSEVTLPWPPPPPPVTQQSLMYNDEGIYEEQEPYLSLEVNAEHQHSESDRSSADEEAPALVDGSSDDDVMACSSEDSSSMSSKGDSEQPEESASEPKKSKIHHIATEIMSSEKVFVDVLKLLHVDFREALSRASLESGKPVIESRLLDQILYYLPQLYELNQDLLQELQSRVAKWDENPQLADIFLKKGPYLKMYSTYIREFDKNVALLEEHRKKNPAFSTAVRGFEASPCCANLALKHYLLKPVQRIPQYQLLLTDYLKNLSEDSNDYKDTQAALGIVKEVANHANDLMKQWDNFQKLVQVQCSLNGQHEIVQPGRIFLKEGILMKLSRKVMQPRMFFLFNDTLLYTTPVQSGQYKLNNMLSLAGVKVSKPSQEAYQTELNIVSVERSFILFASSAAERDEWLEAISTAIGDYTKKRISFLSGQTPEEAELRENDDGALLGSKAPIWIPDPRTTMCMICTCEFTLTWRRHHCRACGKVVCQTCSSNKYSLEYLKNQSARVCDQCFLVLQQQQNLSSPDEQAPPTVVSPSNRATFTFSRKQKKIPAALKEVSANTDNSSMSGYLLRSKGKKKAGKRLWFVIKDKVLYTYAASEDVAALESQPLLGFVLKVDSCQKFKLYHKSTLYYIFKADNLQTGRRWIDSFKESTVL